MKEIHLPPNEPSRSANRRLLLVFAALLLVVPLLGFTITRLYGPQIEREAYSNLDAIARLKAEQIENWMSERYGDCWVLASDDAFAARVVQFVQQQQDARLSRPILERFESLIGNYHYTKILLFDTQGRLLLRSGGDETTSPVPGHLLHLALDSNQVQRSDIYRDAEGDIHLDWAVPIDVADRQGKNMVGVVVLRVTAQQFIFPLIQAWPTASHSGETLLVRRDGESVLFLNQLRHRDYPPMTLRLPLDTPELPAAIAIRENRVGAVAGIDYRGVPVLAACRPLEGTGWYLLAKLDRAEVLAPLRNLVWWVSLITLVAIAVLSVALLLLWKQQQRAHRLEVRASSMAAIEQSELRYRSLFENMLNGFAYCKMLYDADGHPVDFIYLNVNAAFERITGLKNVLGKPVSLVIPGIRELSPEVFEIYGRVAMTGIPEAFEFDFKSQNQWYYISVYSPEKEHFVAVFDDITERKQLERQLSRRLHHLDVMERITPINLDSKSMAELLERVLAEILTVFNADRAWFLHPCAPDAPSWSVPMERTRPEWPGAFARDMMIPTTPEVAEVFRETLASTEPLAYGQAASRSIPAAVAEQFSIRSQMQMALHPRQGGPWIIGLHHCAQAHAYDEDELLLFKDIGLRITDALSSVIVLKNLRKSEENLNRAQAVGQIGSWLLDIPANRLEWSAETYRMFGIPPQQTVNLETFIAAIYPADRDFVRKALVAETDGASYDIEYRIMTGEQIRWISERIQTEHDPEGRPLAIIGTMQDITERKTAETNILKLTQLYAALSESNQAIVRCSSMEELFPQVCQAAVQFGGMKMAWISLLDKSGKLAKPAAAYGAGTEYLEGLQFSLEDDGSFGCSLTSCAINEKHPCWSQDFQHDPLTVQWHEHGIRFGWGSAASLPLLCNDVIVGAFTLYSGTANDFDEAVRKLLIEMTADISFALAGFEREAQRKQAEQVLAESEQRFRGVVEQSLAGIYIIQDGRFVYVNPRFAEIFGYASADELVGIEPLSLVAEQDRAIVAKNIVSRMETGVQSISYGFSAVRKDGSVIDIGVHGARATHGGRPAIIGLMQDVSEKKRADEQIKHYVATLEHAFMNTIEVATTLVEMRDPYTAGHEKRVAQIAVAIGTELGLDTQRIEGLRVGGYIHDIGKIIVPAEILAKPGKISATEYALIKGHPQAGYDILKNVDFPWPVADIAYQHHERMDGSGYPRGLKGEEILLEARITAVADVVEAMSSHRPYRPGIGLAQALLEIELGRGKFYDPLVVDACLKLFREKGYTLPS